jgi:hypothetical protein
MTTRQEHVEHLKQKLDHWNGELSKWEDKARLAKTDMRIEYEMQLEALRKHKETATDKLKELQDSSEGAWKDLAAGADVVWADVRSAFEKAASHFQK